MSDEIVFLPNTHPVTQNTFDYRLSVVFDLLPPTKVVKEVSEFVAGWHWTDELGFVTGQLPKTGMYRLYTMHCKPNSKLHNLFQDGR